MIDWQEVDRHVLDVLRMRYPERLSIARIMDALQIPLEPVSKSLDRLAEAEYAYTEGWGFWKVTDKGLKSGLSTNLEG